MPNIRLDALRERSRQKADMEGSDEFIDNDELNGYINEGRYALYDAKLNADDAKLYAINGPRLVSAGEYAWTLPANFRRLVSLSIQVGTEYYPAISADVSAYPELASNPPDEKSARYFIRKGFDDGTNELYIFPSGLSTVNIGYTYIPDPTELSLNSDTHTGSRDEIEYIITYAVLQMLTKEESNTESVFAALKQLEARIRNAVTDVDASAPKQVRNMRRRYRNRGYDY